MMFLDYSAKTEPKNDKKVIENGVGSARAHRPQTMIGDPLPPLWKPPSFFVPALDHPTRSADSSRYRVARRPWKPFSV